MKNKLSDLNNHLFAQLERLSDEDLTNEELEKEISRTEAIVGVTDKIVRTADLQLKAANLYAEYGAMIVDHLPAIEGKKS
ncbi:MAG: hypothetical protein AAF739_16920 [Pseudomonadota bacterium]